MRFNHPDEVKAAAERHALSLILYAQFHFHDLNPYCTHGARTCFHRGFHDLPLYSWEGTGEWDYQRQLGAATRRLLNSQLQGASQCVTH